MDACIRTGRNLDTEQIEQNQKERNEELEERGKMRRKNQEN